MIASPLLRAGLYLFILLCGSAIGSPFPTPIPEASLLLFALLPLLLEALFTRGKKHTPAPRTRSAYALLLLPIFLFATLGINLLSSLAYTKIGGTLPVVTPSVPVFFGAVIFAPVAEELFFRGLLLRMLAPYGDRRAILLCALCFALLHGNFFQMPYAFTAGLLLACAARFGGSVLYPLGFHLLYNLITLFGQGVPPVILLAVFGVSAFSALIPLLLRRPFRLTKGGAPIAFSELPVLLLYGIFMLALAVLNLF